MARLENLAFCALLSACAAQPETTTVDAPSPRAAEAPCESDAAPANQLQTTLEVWIDLSVPPLSSLGPQKSKARDALRARIREQQDEVMSQLAALGAVELARVVQVRNAIAVRISIPAFEQAQSIPGVVNVRVVKHRKRTPPCSSRN